jgi:hypothetical protein
MVEELAVHAEAFPSWTMLPFPALVLAIAIVPLLAPRVGAPLRCTGSSAEARDPPAY